MDVTGKGWYHSGMSLASQIPVFNLFGETGAFPDVVHCERIRDRARLHDWEIAPHRHREMAQVFYMEQGAARARLDGREIPLDDGIFLFVPAQVVHGFAFRQGAEGLVLSFPLTLVSGLAGASAGLGARLSRAFAARADERAAALMRQIADAFAGHGTFRAPLLAGLAQALLAVVAEAGDRAAAETQPLAQRRMIAFDTLLAEHLADGWSAADFASALAMSPGHLNRICRAATGASVSRHIETARMTEARRLLAFTRLPVAEIGYRLGFSDPPYFSRRFRAVTGETPSDYRERFAG